MKRQPAKSYDLYRSPGRFFAHTQAFVHRGWVLNIPHTLHHTRIDPNPFLEKFVRQSLAQKAERLDVFLGYARCPKQWIPLEIRKVICAPLQHFTIRNGQFTVGHACQVFVVRHNHERVTKFIPQIEKKFVKLCGIGGIQIA